MLSLILTKEIEDEKRFNKPNLADENLDMDDSEQNFSSMVADDFSNTFSTRDNWFLILPEVSSENSDR